MSTLHFTLGPVQAFVAQARRTRDLWAGSFLLSWLSGQAMRAVLDHGGRVIFPSVQDTEGIPTDPLLRAINGHGGKPSIGSLPNRFMAEIPDAEAGLAAEKAVRDAWSLVAGKIYEKYVAPVAEHGRGTEHLWDRQVSGFWEIAWAVGDDPALLDRRKNWRTHHPSPEYGEQCTIMSGYQEISGYLRIRKDEREKQETFWAKLRAKGGLSDMELRESERLCAVALIKRLFPKISPDTIGWQLDVSNWPATPYMAAVPFMVRALEKAHDECAEYAQTVKELCGGRIYGERSTRIMSLNQYHGQRFCDLDGDLFHRSAITDTATRIPTLGDKHSDQRKKLDKALRYLQETAGMKASPFFAVLLMDGDSLGAKLREAAGKGSLISEALAEFTAKVPEVVSGLDGVTVYAGGDDVLALFPINTVFDAALSLKALYENCFENHCAGKMSFSEPPTISAGVVFTHFSHPLQDIMREAHRLLDQQAKEATGRNALAAGLYKGESLNAEWKVKWQTVPELTDLMHLLDKLEDTGRGLSSSFVYRIRETLRLLDSRPQREIGDSYEIPEQLDLKSFLAADLRKALAVEDNDAKASKETCDDTIATLLRACGYNGQRFAPDGIFLARFLSQAQRGEL